MSTDKRLQTYWEDIKPLIRQQWPEITDEDLKKINASYDRFFDYLKEYYGLIAFPKNEAIALDLFNRVFKKFDDRPFEKTA
ncbi:MAG: hypothetical protein H7A33_03000 [Deltaproteobacteria bacterium]|nr:hypothetical protein [Deltaproteobacteria bacterium]